jgi:hypothetical protein
MLQMLLLVSRPLNDLVMNYLWANDYENQAKQ